MFTTNAASETTTFDLGHGSVIAASGVASTVQVSYDAGTKSYTVATSDRKQTFSPADVQAGIFTGETRYVKTSVAGRDYLTLVVAPYTGKTANKYVGLGYWQRNVVDGSVQSTSFDSFVYGFDTVASAVPRVGSGGYVVDAFGLVTTPGKEAKAFSGSGTFDVDFLRGLFQTKVMVGEYSLTSDSYGSGGTIQLQGAGHLSSGNGFSGNISYTGFDGTVAGKMSGLFFGPNAQELGASFTTDNAGGAVVTGGLTGQLDGTRAPVTLAVSNVVVDTDFTEHFSEFNSGNDTSLTPAFRGSIGYNGQEAGKVTVRKDGTVVVTLANSVSPPTTFAASDRSPVQRVNFTSYDVVAPAGPLGGGGPTHLDLYQPGAANTELALSYLSFGIWAQAYQNATYSQVRKDFLVYGLETPAGLLSRRTGSASYGGVVYGATTTDTGVLQDVGGTSRFDVDFGAHQFSGALDLTAQAAGGAVNALGTWTFADRLTAGQMVETRLSKSGVSAPAPLAYNSITPRFYGPNGEEIGATFSIQKGYPSDVGTTAITGVTVAKQR
jgi:hypothetical protein